MGNEEWARRLTRPLTHNGSGLAAASVVVTAGAVDVAMGHLFGSCGADADDLDLVVQGAASKRVVGVDIHIEAPGLQHQGITNAPTGLDGDDLARRQLLLAWTQMKVLDRHPLDGIGVARTVGLMWFQRDGELFSHTFASHDLFQAGNDVAVSMQVVQWLASE